MESSKAKTVKSKSDTLSLTRKPGVNEAISIEETKQYFVKYQLPDERIADIKNNLIGIVDTVINNYLENFK